MFTRVSEERFVRPLLRAPLEISADIRALCADVNPTEVPRFVPYRPGAGCAPQECYNNVLGRVAEAGGDYVVGWAIWERPELWVEAEHHAVWRGPDGLVDITPHGIPVEQVLFLPDPGAPYLGPDAPRRPNRRRLLSQGGLAKPFLEAVDARNLWFEQFPAGELKNLTQQQVSAFQDLEKRAALTSADLLIAHANSKSRNDRCLCGSGRKFKICCLPEFD